MKKSISLIVIVAACCACNSKNPPKISKGNNIVLIVADDLGYSDLGCFGSEIETPNIDSLARAGMQFTGFYTGATCSPTRSMLLSGTDNHIAGLGDMAERAIGIPEEVGQPGYEGYLNSKVISVAELLKGAGYHTYIAGKWHLGTTPDHSPLANGFERSFTLLGAYAPHYNPDPNLFRFWENDGFGKYPEGAYSTDLYTDKMVNFIDGDKDDQHPFFLFAAYTSPHFPLQAPQKFTDKYKGLYDIGYDSLRALRFHRLKELNLISKNVILPALPVVKGNLYNISNRPLVPWKSLSLDEQKIESRKMEIYAGMVDNLDYNIGRLIQHLKDIGQYDNTMFIFLSDNGADQLDLNETPDENNPLGYMGTENSFIGYGPQWAHASSAVNSFYKGYSAEGGIHCPMIIKMPGQKSRGTITSAFTTVKDMAPTFLEIAGVTYPTAWNGNALSAYEGKSLIPFLKDEQKFIHDENYVMGWELFQRSALRKGKWKIRKMEPPFGTGNFELFNIETDPTESYDLSKEIPDLYQEMLAHWDAYVKEHGVILLKK